MEPKDSLPHYRYPSLDLLNPENRRALLSLLTESPFKMPVLWSAETGKFIWKDLYEYRNLIIVGPALMGKTGFINQLIVSLLFKFHPSEIKLILMDSRRNEFGVFRILERHFLAKIAGEESAIVETPDQGYRTLEKLCLTMRERYDLFRLARVKEIEQYNQKVRADVINADQGHVYLPILVLVIDEVANVTIAGRSEVHDLLRQLVYEGGKAGIITILSTNQYGSGEVINSELLRGFQQRVAFRFNDRDDYRKYYDTVRIPDINFPGEFVFREYSTPVKGKTAIFTEAEVEAVCEAISIQECYREPYFLCEPLESETSIDWQDKDPLLEDAARLIVSSQMGSTSLIQRRMKLGYNRAGRIMDQLEAVGIVGTNSGASARDVLIKSDEELERFLSSMEDGKPYVAPTPQMVQPVIQQETIVRNAPVERYYPPRTAKRGRKQSGSIWSALLFIIILWWLIKSC